MAILSGGSVWLLGPNLITGGGRRSFSAIITSLVAEQGDEKKNRRGLG